MAAVEANVKPEDGGDTKTTSKVPDWLEAKLFEDLLKASITDYKGIKNFKATPAMTPGENYASTMLRIGIDVELQMDVTICVSYMIKVAIDSAVHREMMKGRNIFQLETGMYHDVVPEFEQMYREAGLEVDFGAECYKLPTTEDYVLLEDLSTLGFKNANRLEGLDMTHTKCVLKKLAQWHAASAKRVEVKGRYAKEYEAGAFTEDRLELFRQMSEGMTGAFMKCLQKYEGHEAYIESVEKLIPKYIDELFRLNKIDVNEFNVLNHGDCWSNNIMFQYDAFGKIRETYFVDFQMPKYGTPAIDLFYFLLSSTKFEIKTKQFEHLIKYYHDNLVEHLNLLKYPKKIPALKDIHIQLYKYGVWGFNVAITIMAGTLLDPTDLASAENFFSESSEGVDFKMLLYSNARYRKHIEAILPWLHNRGAIDADY